jgi:hypothetical protein
MFLNKRDFFYTLNNVPYMPKLSHWQHDADSKLTATEPSKRQFGAAFLPPGMRVLNKAAKRQ